MVRQPLPSIHDLIPFDLALNLIYRRIYLERMNIAVLGNAHIDGLAHLVSAIVPLYIYTADRGAVRKAGAEELKGGLFSAGGKRLYFLDGRAEVTNLAVTSDATTTAITALKMSLPDEGAAL